MTIHKNHIEMVEKVNNSKTKHEYDINYWTLQGWRQGVEDTGRTLDLCACDMFYIDQGIDRPMCCGVFLDCKESDK